MEASAVRATSLEDSDGGYQINLKFTDVDEDTKVKLGRYIQGLISP